MPSLSGRICTHQTKETDKLAPELEYWNVFSEGTLILYKCLSRKNSVRVNFGKDE